MFVRVACCVGFVTLPIYNPQNLYAGISLLVKILIRNSRFDKANDAFNCILVYIYCSPEASVVCVNSKGFYSLLLVVTKPPCRYSNDKRRDNHVGVHNKIYLYNIT